MIRCKLCGVVIAGIVFGAQLAHACSGGDLRDEREYPHYVMAAGYSGTATASGASSDSFSVNDGNVDELHFVGFHGKLEQGLSQEVSSIRRPKRTS